ncbi:MAG: S24 family peptidase, partial [Muribaculaceae bacterium]|nr:S24 family peptidase [Muribaculaceae bacterium]
GSILFIKRINERAFIPWGNPMVVDTENGVLVKALYPLEPEEDNYIEARSYNPSYPPLKIPVTSIYSLYRILSATKQYSTI